MNKLFSISSNLYKICTDNNTTKIGLGIVFVVILSAMLAPWITTFDPIEQDIFSRLQGPTNEHLLGTDGFGRDILSRILYGGQISLTIGFTSVIVAIVIGSLIGIIAGYYGGKVDIFLMQLMDILLAPEFKSEVRHFHFKQLSTFL